MDIPQQKLCWRPWALPCQKARARLAKTKLAYTGLRTPSSSRPQGHALALTASEDRFRRPRRPRHELHSEPQSLARFVQARSVRLKQPAARLVKAPIVACLRARLVSRLIDQSAIGAQDPRRWHL